MTLLELLRLLRRHLKLVIALPVLFAVIVGVATQFLPDEYTAQTSMYVLSKTDTAVDSTSTTLSSDLSASQMLANDVTTIAESNRVQADVAESLGLSDLDDFDISVESSTTTRVITMSVTGEDPQMAARVANAFVQHVSDTAQSVMEIKAVNAIDQAQAPSTPSGPSRALYTAVAFLAGLFLAVAFVVLADMVNTKARNDDDIAELVDVPIVGHFPLVN